MSESFTRQDIVDLCSSIDPSYKNGWVEMREEDLQRMREAVDAMTYAVPFSTQSSLPKTLFGLPVVVNTFSYEEARGNAAQQGAETEAALAAEAKEQLTELADRKFGYAKVRLQIDMLYTVLAGDDDEEKRYYIEEHCCHHNYLGALEDIVRDGYCTQCALGEATYMGMASDEEALNWEVMKARARASEAEEGNDNL